MVIPPTSKTADFRNWLKGASALKLAKEGLTNFVETEINELRTDLIQSVIKNNELPSDVTCTQCTTANLLPCPTPGFCNRVRCEVHGYHSSDQKPNQPCPNGLCNDLKNAIEKEHRFHSPSWKNSDARRWSTDAMEICKCFLPSCGYDRINSIQDIDFNGILSIVINNRRFQLKMTSSLSTQRNVCTKARDVRNVIVHSKNCELSDIELTQHIEVLKDLLSDQACLANDAKAKYAVDELTKLQKTDVVTIEDMMRLLEDTVQTQICAQHEKTLELNANYFPSTKVRKELTELEDTVVKASKEELKQLKPEMENLTSWIKTDEDEAPIHKESPEPNIYTVPAQPSDAYMNSGCISTDEIPDKETQLLTKKLRETRSSFVDRCIEIVHRNIDVYRTSAEKITCGMTAHPSDAYMNPDCISTEPTKEIPDKETQLLTKKLTELEGTVIKRGKEELKQLKPQLENLTSWIKTDEDEAPIHKESAEPDIYTVPALPSDAYMNPDCISTEPTKEIPDKETQLLTKKWEDYIQGLGSYETITIESLIDELGFPTTDQLNELQEKYLKPGSEKTLHNLCSMLKTIEHRVCKVIMSNNKDIKYAWLAFTAEKTIDVQLIVEVKQIRSKINSENVPYRPQVIQFDDFSKEADLLIAKCEENESFEDFDAIQGCINKNAQELMKKHKHLSIIHVSTVRSKDFYKSGEVNAIKENCIVFYVHRKGLIPVGEKPFEDMYYGFPIDVREGVFYPSMQAEDDGSTTLKMGLRIKAEEKPDYWGTLGGFIEHPQYGLCGFTCAHVLLDKYQMNTLKKKRERTGKDFPTEISVYLDSDPQDDSPVKIGHVVIAILTSGDDSTPGMDVAFFQIEKHLQVAGVLVNVNNANDNKPFDSGKVYKPPKFSTNLGVYKYGSTSGKTEGKYHLYSKAAVRLPVRPCNASEELTFIDHVLHNQIVINPNTNGPFSRDGDSGSLVMMDGDNGERFGIGIVEGIASYGASFVTPLSPILDKLSLSSLKCFKEYLVQNDIRDIRKSIKLLENGLAEILRKLEELKNKPD